MCTSPDRWEWSRERGKFHPAPWEIEVQSQLRDLKPKLPPGETLLLGTDGKTVVAASYFGFDSTGEQFQIWAVARHVEYAGQALGAAALEITLQSLRNTKKETGRDCGVFTRIDVRNEASQRMFSRAGFWQHDTIGQLGFWVNELR